VAWLQGTETDAVRQLCIHITGQVQVTIVYHIRGNKLARAVT